ncbi:hypothetical protein [Sphingopyxis sp. JAI128]|nr:hypothetical protein [Sphingopyxis sp. JAI128]MBB6425036.1 hypothetical protein [Sphingopyxis sp. JAI128]
MHTNLLFPIVDFAVFAAAPAHGPSDAGASPATVVPAAPTAAI